MIFLMVLELLESRRGDPYMAVNGNFVRFAHSELFIANMASTVFHVFHVW